MKKRNQILYDSLFTAGVVLATFLVNLWIGRLFQTQNMIPMIFVMGVFLVSWRTQGYLYGIAASALSVLLMNFAFTSPLWAFDLISPESLASAAVMLVVSTMTSALTTKIKHQQKLKAEGELERMRGNLLRAVSHDLRTPLTAIYGACSTMAENFDELPREKHLKMLADVCSDVQWLVGMVENLLSVTRVDGGQVNLTKTDTVLEELIDVLLVKFHKRYPQQPVEVDIPETFLSIPMDAMLIQQVLMNLLENAALHAKGMEHLLLKVEIVKHQAVFSVIDDGCGIPPERMEALFTGLSGQSGDRGRGMGIGLSVCSAIVVAHGGQLKARNRRKGGAEFTFALDLEDSHEQ